MKRIDRLFSSIVVASIVLFAAHSIHADVVADWNAIAVQSTITGARPGATGVVDLAMVHAAIYDAVQGIEKDYEPYYVDIPGATGNINAAAARAARDVLVSRFPSQIDTIHATYLQIPDDTRHSRERPGSCSRDNSGSGNRCDAVRATEAFRQSLRRRLSVGQESVFGDRHLRRICRCRLPGWQT